jgi:hypothetical protein
VALPEGSWRQDVGAPFGSWVSDKGAVLPAWSAFYALETNE